ncbi:hypothetical protein D3C80_2028600 [compost metagenome]
MFELALVRNVFQTELQIYFSGYILYRTDHGGVLLPGIQPRCIIQDGHGIQARIDRNILVSDQLRQLLQKRKYVYKDRFALIGI